MTIRFFISCVLLAVFTACAPTLARAAVRTGPAEHPDRWPDYGGTPDIAAAGDMGLTAGELRVLLGRLGSPDQSVRAGAVEELRRDATGSEAVLKKALWGDHGARNTEMKQAVREARRRAKQDAKEQDLLLGLLSIDPTDGELGSGATGALEILAMLLALDDLDTMAGYKVMIDFSPRHAGIFRHEIGRMLVAHGLDALPALVYGRGSENEEIHMFAVKWIRDMGNPLLSEQVKLKNPRRLAQLLEAYASVNELEAIDVTLALTNHESVFVRAAARSSLAKYGRNALWSVRRLYELTFGEEPPTETEVGKLLGDLYRHFDSRRLAESMELFELGLSSYRAGRLEEMAASYKEVLRDNHMFPRRQEMAAGFLAFGEVLLGRGRPDQAKAELATALRVAEPGSASRRIVEARLLWLEAEQLRSSGVADPEIYGRVVALDPDHVEAKKQCQELSSDKLSAGRVVTKALAVSVVVFLALMLVFLRLR